MALAGWRPLSSRRPAPGVALAAYISSIYTDGAEAAEEVLELAQGLVEEAEASRISSPYLRLLGPPIRSRFQPQPQRELSVARSRSGHSLRSKGRQVDPLRAVVETPRFMGPTRSLLPISVELLDGAEPLGTQGATGLTIQVGKVASAVLGRTPVEVEALGLAQPEGPVALVEGPQRQAPMPQPIAALEAAAEGFPQRAALAVLAKYRHSGWIDA